MIFSCEKVTFSCEKVTFSSEKVTFCDILVSWGILGFLEGPGVSNPGHEDMLIVAPWLHLGSLWIIFLIKKWFIFVLFFCMPFWIAFLLIFHDFGMLFESFFRVFLITL